jgi:hypothetical protein
MEFFCFVKGKTHSLLFILTWVPKFQSYWPALLNPAKKNKSKLFKATIPTSGLLIPVGYNPYPPIRARYPGYSYPCADIGGYTSIRVRT